jgi:2-oxoacid:acceptor oxidoreductase gamma subunit (pyruvate/2-ketoisovalerate family)
MRELRIHGRGGQGSVIASKLLAVALFREGNWVQSFPAFGVERRGAPVTAFLRLDDRPIRLRCEITHPDDLIVLDPTLVEAVDVTGGLAPGGTILINSEKAPEEYGSLLERFRVATIDASGIMECMADAIREVVPSKHDENIAAAREAAEAVRVAGPVKVPEVSGV